MSVNVTQHSPEGVSTDSNHDPVTVLVFRAPGESDPLVSSNTLEVCKFAFECCVQQVIMGLGIPGNILCLIVFAKEDLKNRINLLLFSVAMVDVTILICQLLPKFSCYIQQWDAVHAHNWDIVLSTYLMQINTLLSIESGFLILVISVDRCISVVFPLKAGRILTYRPTLVAIVCTFLISLVFAIPNFFIYTIGWAWDPATNRSLAYTAVVDDYLDPATPLLISTISGLILKPLFVLTVTLASIVTIRQLFRASQERNKMKESQQTGTGGGDGGERRIGLIMVLVCVIYAVLVLPDICWGIAYFFVPEFFMWRLYHNTFLLMSIVVFTTSGLNSSVNFLAYLTLSTRFRKTLREVLPCFNGQESRNVFK